MKLLLNLNAKIKYVKNSFNREKYVEYDTKWMINWQID